MNFDKIKSVFEEIENRYQLPNYLREICAEISDGNCTYEKIQFILIRHNTHTSVAKINFLNLIFEYIKIALEDNTLTKEEKSLIQFLKKVFRIQEGDFLLHNKAEIELVIANQLAKIYKDNYVSEDEAILKVDIQDLFDLSFDQMNIYSKVEAIVSLHQGADPKDLDIFFTNNELFKLKQTF